MTKLYSKYQKEVVPKLKEEFNLKNDLAVPKVEKIVLNMGIAEALTSKDIIEKTSGQLMAIGGQKPKITRAKKSIASFKLRQGDAIGLMTTLRGKKAWYFLEKLISIVAPRMRDFRGISQRGFDKRGNYSLGITEHILFPEVDYSKVDKIRGLVITVVFKNSIPQKSKRLFELLGLPFRKDEKEQNG